LIKLFQKFVARRRRNGGRSSQRAKFLRGVFFLLAFSFALVVSKEKASKKFILSYDLLF